MAVEQQGHPHDDVPTSIMPEVEVFAYLLVITFLVDQKQFAEVRAPGCNAIDRFHVPVGIADVSTQSRATKLLKLMAFHPVCLVASGNQQVSYRHRPQMVSSMFAG